MLNEIFHFKEDIMLELTISSISTAIINLNPHARTLGTTINETVQTAGY